MKLIKACYEGLNKIIIVGNVVGEITNRQEYILDKYIYSQNDGCFAVAIKELLVPKSISFPLTDTDLFEEYCELIGSHTNHETDTKDKDASIMVISK